MELEKILEDYLANRGFKITLDCSLCDLNKYINAERTNRFIAARIKKENQEMCEWLLPKKKFDKVFIVFKWFVKNKRKDPDNIAFSKKFILDAMVSTGMLKNDGQNQIVGFLDLFANDETEKIEITMLEVEK
jgi:Holliday junction resolvase RusA-like endonuclease